MVLESLKEKRGIVTANLTTPYIFNFSNLANGPIQIGYPPGETADGVLDFWQRPVFDLGLAGPDRGQGATYIVVGPNDDPTRYKNAGAHIFQSATNNVFIGLRILDQDPAFYDKFTKSYGMGRVGDERKPSRFIRGKEVEWSATAPRGLDYWRKLPEILQEEPAREIDKGWLAMLEPLGIAKGKPFKPDDRLQAILANGAAMGELMTRNLQVNPRYTNPYWPDTFWYKSFDFQIEQETADIAQIDQRATWFFEAVASSKGMVNPQPGAGQVYRTTIHDNYT